MDTQELGELETTSSDILAIFNLALDQMCDATLEAMTIITTSFDPEDPAARAVSLEVAKIVEAGMMLDVLCTILTDRLATAPSNN